MPFRSFTIAMIAAATLSAAGPAHAQGLGSLLGNGLPGLGSAGVGNVAGLLGFCIKNKLTGGAAAQSVLGKLTGQPEITQSQGYKQGLLGQIVGGGATATNQGTGQGTGQSGVGQVLSQVTGQPTGQSAQPGLSLNSLKGQLKTRACDMVLSRAGSFL